MTTDNNILLLYPTAADEKSGQALKDAFQSMGVAVEDMVIEQNYDRVLDAVEKSVIPVVVS